jgi:predicted MFS family arabinose efflux permease
MKRESLLSKEFVILNVASFLAQINMAVFFQLHQYLLTLPIDQRYAGFLIGVFSLSGVAMQPVLSPFVNERNARRTLVIGVFVTIGGLLMYRWATSFPSILVVRIIHGVGFITFVTAMNASLVSFIPPARSGQAFGLISINMLIPMAVVPALLGWLNLGPAHFVDVLTVTAALMVPTALLPLFVLSGRQSRGPAIDHRKRGVWSEIVEDFADPRIPVLLGTNFLAFLAYTPVFFFFKEYAEGKGIENPGTFFSVATGAMIIIRLLGGTLFDHLNKVRMLIFSLSLLSLGYALLVFAAPGVFLLLALVLGVGWSLVMPFLNALLFDCSRPSARALNLNFSMVLLQAGYFVGPIVGTLILRSAGYNAVFLYCGLMTFIGVCLNLFFAKSYVKQSHEGHAA